jgi:hypothetical protein
MRQADGKENRDEHEINGLNKPQLQARIRIYCRRCNKPATTKQGKCVVCGSNEFYCGNRRLTIEPLS